MAIPTDTQTRQNQSFKESTSLGGQVGVVVINPDGSNVGGSSTPVSGVYNSTPPTLTNGQSSVFQLDSQGDLKVYVASVDAGQDYGFTQTSVIGTQRTSNLPVLSATYSPSVDVAFLNSVTHNSKSTPGNILSFSVTSVNAAIRYFQLFNAASATGTPIYSFPIPAGSSTAPATVGKGSEFFTTNGVYFSTALSWGISTAAATYSAATTTDHTVNLNYV